MPKDLQPNKPCRADTKKSTNASAGGGGGGKSVTSSNAKASKVIASKAAKKKPDTKKKPPKVVAGSDGGGEKVKGKKKAEPIKTRSGVRLVDSNAGNRTTAANKMKDKQKTATGADKGKGKDEKGKVIKKEPGVAKKSATSVSCAGGVGSNVGVVKKEVKKVKCDNNDDTARKPTKSVKKDDADRKEITVKTEENDDVENVKKDAKRGRETPSQGVKKTTSKVKKDEGDKKDTCKMVDKTDDKKEAIKKEEEPTKKEPAKKDLKTKDDAVKTANDKESKSKSTKASKKRPKSDDKCVYDNIDEGSDDASKKVKKKDTSTTKTKLAKIGEETEIKIRKHLEEFKKSKPKQRKPAASKSDDKRKLDSDSDVESKKCRKKLKKNVEDEDDEIEEPSPPVKAKTPVKKSAAKAPAKEEEHSSQSSDDVPLNKLKNSKCKTVDRKPSPKKPAKGKKEEKPSTSPVATKCAPKKVRFDKEATKSPPTAPPAKAVRRRKPRMASLNAMAMVHCLYENEYKSVSVSSHDSTDNSDDNATESASEPVAVKRKSESGATASPSKSAANAKETALVKYEKDATSVDEPDPVICRESLRSAPGLRSVGKHWDMNSSSISSTLSDENIEIIAPPVVIKEIVAVDKPMTVKNALKKKFARALRRQISEESSEEEKHQALLLEEKKRMVRRRRRQRKEITMDLKDMVVCKRMASLNATAILAASYSSTTGKRTITVKSTGKGEEKRENVENFEKTESVIAKIKNRKLPFIRKKFSSSSDADVEDEADLSGNEVVLKTASSSGKQQVSLIVNQDSGVTITGVYLNSTTKSTHHQGYCSISGMQYRISSTSHTQTEATAVASEAIVRTPQEPLRPPITVSLHPDRQSPPPPHNVALAAGHPSPVKTYTPLGALSNMQPPGSPHHVHHLHHHPKTVTISATQEISSLERHGCPSAFSAPTVYGPAPPPPLPSVPARPPYPILSKTPPEAGFVTGYYQPAGPLISHHHHHHHHHHHVQANTTTTTSTAAALPASSATPASSSAPAMSYSTKVSQSPLVQPPTPPASNVTHPVSENSDNEMTSATTPAAEIAQSTDTAPEETNFPPTYRFGPPPSANPPFHSPSRNYQSYYPSPPSTASLSHPQQQAHFQEILYSGNPAAGPPAPYHLSYLQPKAAPYHGSFQRRYIPALPPQQYFHHEYSSSVPASNAVQQQVVVPAHPLTSTADSYHSAPPTPSVVESYPPPPPLYYSGYNSAPPTPYYPYATSSRSLTLVETSCPCPLQGCQKNVHTGPLTGIISKGPVKQHSTPLSPVALSLPKEPQDIRSLPSPARGSAGCRPTPSPAIATAKNPSSCWSEGTDGSSYDTTGLLAISKHDERRSPAPTKNGCKSSRSELKKLKIKKIKSRSKSVKQHQVCKSDENMAEFRLNGAGRQFYADARENSDTVGLMAAQAVTDYVTRVKPTIVDVCETEVYDENTLDTSDEPKTKKYHQCRKRRMDDEADKDMLKSYPVMRENVQKGIHASPDDQTPKKPKLEVEPHVNPTDDDKPVDVEKNNYLSALQLCSVTEVEAAPEQDELAKDSCATAENLAPTRKREDDKNLKIAAKPQEEVERCSERTADTIVEQPQPDDVDRASASAPPCQTQVESKKPPRLRRKRWTNKKRNKKKTSKATKGSEEEKIEAENAEKIRRAELLSLTQKRSESKLKWSNGWSWLGEPFVSKVFLNTEGSEVLRTCYHAMKHQAGDIIKPKDCILLRSGSKKSDLPYVAKVAHLWEDPEDGEMMMSLFWFYRPEHTEHDSMHSKSPYELYASKHKDINSVACIEDKCYVLTFNEYCRYHKSLRQSEESVDVSSVIVPPLSKKRYPRHSLLPPENTSLDLVFFCRKIYDFRQHRLLKNPFFV